MSKQFVLNVIMVFALWGFVYNASATQQVMDKLIYEGKSVKSPVYSWCDDKGIYADSFLEKYLAEELPGSTNLIAPGMSTACRRGYIATWEIKEEKIYLVKLDTESFFDEPGEPIPLSRIFPDASTNQVFASWVTAQVRIPQGRELPFRHNGSGSDFERDLYVDFTNGVVKSKIEVDNLGATALMAVECARWILAADRPVDDGRSYLWNDLREVATDEFYEKKVEYDQTVRTRGFFVNSTDPDVPPEIDVPRTRLTPYVYLYLHSIPEEFAVSNMTPVEIEAKFIADEYNHNELKVESIRALMPGEFIHHPYFKLPMQKIAP